MFNHATLNTVSMGSRRIRRGPYSVSPRLALLDVSSSSGRIDDIDPADVGPCTVVAVDDRVLLAWQERLLLLFPSAADVFV